MAEAIIQTSMEEKKFCNDLNNMKYGSDIVHYLEKKSTAKRLSDEKSAEKSDLYRTHGNEQYRRKNYVEALELF